MDVPISKGALRSRLKWKYATAIAIILIIAAIGAAQYWIPSTTSVVDDDVLWSEVKRGDLDDRVAGVGEFVSAQQRDLTAGDRGVVQSILKGPGDSLNQGDLILVLGNKELELEAESARSEVRRVEIENAQAQLRDDEAIEHARVGLESATYAAQIASLERELNAEMWKRQLVSRLQFETVGARAKSADASLQSAERLLVLARRQRERASALREEALGLARRKSDRLMERVNGLSITSHDQAWVKNIFVNPGDVVAAGALLATVGPLSPDSAQVRFPQSVLARLKAGVMVELKLADQAFSGRIQRVAPDPVDGMVRADVVVDAMPESARVGMSVRADAVFGTRRNVLYARVPGNFSPAGALEVYRKRGADVKELRLSDIESVSNNLIFHSHVDVGDLVSVKSDL